MNDTIKSLDDLYNKVLPALRIKKRELEKRDINTSEKEIFRTLLESKWKHEGNLGLNVVVNDILNYKNNIF